MWQLWSLIQLFHRSDTYSTWGEVYLKELGIKSLFISSHLNVLTPWVSVNIHSEHGVILNFAFSLAASEVTVAKLLMWFSCQASVGSVNNISLLVNGFDSQFLWLIDQDAMNSTVRRKKQETDILQKDSLFWWHKCPVPSLHYMTLAYVFPPVWCTLDPTEGLPILAQSCSLPLVLARDSALRLTCSGPRPPKICPRGPDT